MKALSSLQNRKNLNIFLIISIAIGFLVAAVNAVNFLFFYETEKAYFQTNAFLPIALTVIIVAGVVFFALGSIFTVDNKASVPTPSKYAKYVAIIPALAMILFVIMKFGELAPAYEKFADPANPNKLPFIYLCGLLTAAAISVLFFFSVSLAKNSSGITVLSSIGFFAWGILSWITSYTEFMTPLNSPDKMLFHLGCLGAILFTVSELRTMYNISKPKFYYFSLSASIMLLSASSIPYIVGVFANRFKYPLLFEGNIVLFAFLCYTVARAITILSQNRIDKDVANNEPEETTEE